jgi:hypothetical protein
MRIKRDVLPHYGAALGEWLEVESVLHWDLRAIEISSDGSGGAGQSTKQRKAENLWLMTS